MNSNIKSIPRDKGLVILLHGILRSTFDMWPLSVYLQKYGYRTLNILYPARKYDLKTLAAYVQEKITACPDAADAPHINFVTHSMGGLVTRYLIANNRPEKLGRVVMLSPPNTGSEMADALMQNNALRPFYKTIFGPAGQQLLTSFVHSKESQYINYPLGIIAGSRSINPLAGALLKGRTDSIHDGIVPVARTALNGMQGHITLPVSHGLMMFNPEVMRQTLTFLNAGKFDNFSE
jgi:pimeloyl-ACP methyl ester carboxylesterase